MTYTITYKGPGFSLNDAYKIHWTQAKKKKDALKMDFRLLLRDAGVPKIEKFRLQVSFNARYDVDNIIPVLKVFVDVLRYETLIPDDTKHYYKGLSIDYDDNLPSNTYVITIVPIQMQKTKKSRKSRKKKIELIEKALDEKAKREPDI